MKISRPEIINLITKIHRQEQTRPRVKDSSSTVEGATGDRLEISASSSALKKELARLEEVDTARSERVAELTRQIEAGEYRVDARELAHIILNHVDQGRV